MPLNLTELIIRGYMLQFIAEPWAQAASNFCDFTRLRMNEIMVLASPYYDGNNGDNNQEDYSRTLRRGRRLNILMACFP